MTTKPDTLGCFVALAGFTLVGITAGHVLVGKARAAS
jgi:hypothetical protein